jgi:hypothetical protein
MDLVAVEDDSGKMVVEEAEANEIELCRPGAPGVTVAISELCISGATGDIGRCAWM